MRSDFSVGKTAGSCRGRAVSRLLVCEEGLWGVPDRLQGEDAVVSGKCYGDAGGLDLLMVPGVPDRGGRREKGMVEAWKPLGQGWIMIGRRGGTAVTRERHRPCKLLGDLASEAGASPEPTSAQSTSLGPSCAHGPDLPA